MSENKHYSMSKSEYEYIQDKLAVLLFRRAEILKEIEEVREEQFETAEYIAACEDRDKNEAEIEKLKQCLANTTIVDNAAPSAP